MNKKTIYKKSAKFFQDEAQKLLIKLSKCSDPDLFKVYHCQLEALKVRINLELKLIDEFSDGEDAS